MSQETEPSPSCLLNENDDSLHRQSVVKSYGISIDSTKIHQVSIENRPENLCALGVNIFDHDVFEKAVLQQVDEAIAKEEEALEKEKLMKNLKTIEEELRKISSKILTAKKHVKDTLQNEYETLNKKKDEILLMLQKQIHHKGEIATMSNENHNDDISFVLKPDGLPETDTERLVRLGEMTPFGSIIHSHSHDTSEREEALATGFNDPPSLLDTTDLMCFINDTNTDTGQCSSSSSDVTPSIFQQIDNNTHQKIALNTVKIPKNDSDEDYIPDEEDFESSAFHDDNIHSTSEEDNSCDDICTKDGKKKRKRGKVKATIESKRMKRITKDDGDDRIYQRRIREFRLKQSLRKKGIQYEGEQDEEDILWSEDESYEELEGGLKIPAVIWNKLFRYQKTGVKWLWELHSQQAGGIVGDEMGLGKTIQIISFLCGLKYSKIGRRSSKKKGLGPVLIVTPATVLFQWVAEFHKWWPEFRVAVLHDTGSHRGGKDSLVSKICNEPGVLLTTYSGVRLNRDSLLQSRWDYVILDEGHIIRNPDAEVTLTCKQFRTPHRLVLSGSPMQNNLRELWSLFDFVYPGKLGTLPVFMQEFSVPITMGGYSNASSVQVETAYRCACVLRDTINPYLLRRLKNDVKMKLDLPNKNEQVLFCRLTEEQVALYKEYLASRDVSSILSGNMKVFPGLIMLRKICNHPDLTSQAGSIWKLRKDREDKVTNTTKDADDLGYGDWKRSGKLIVVQSLLKLWKKQKHKVLLFTQTRQMLKILEIFVKSQGYSYRRMDGSTSISSRQPLIEKFNKDDSIFVFLLTTRVGGLGVNLVGADRVIIYDPDWNPGTDMQARERAWRVGQKKDVTIYRLLTTGTIEEKIYHRQIFKQFLTNRVLKEPKQRRFFKSNDLFELFTLDTSDNKKSGTETSAIFAGLGCEVPVPCKKSKFGKRKHETSSKENILKSIRERTQEILRTQFSSRRESEKKDNSEKKASDIVDGTEYVSEEDKDGRICIEEKILENEGNDETSKSSENKEIVSNCGFTISSKDCDESQSARLSISSCVDATSSSYDDRSCGKRRNLEEQSRISGEDNKYSHQNERKDVIKDKQKKKKRKQRNKVEGVRIGQLSHSEVYSEKKSSEERNNTDDDYILRSLFKKSGVHSALQHDAIVNSGNADHILVENEAKRIATQAVEALKRSRDQCMQLRNTGLPTWTGQCGIVGSPFGLQGRKMFGPQSNRKTQCDDENDSGKMFSGKCSGQKKEAAVLCSSGEAMSSAQLLARMRARNSIGGVNVGDNIQASEQKYVQTMTEIRNFIASRCSCPGSATTSEILEEFRSRLSIDESAIFRQMLRSICDFDRSGSGQGYWILKSEFL